MFDNSLKMLSGAIPEYGSNCEVSAVHGVAGGHHVGGGERLRRQVGHGEVPVVGGSINS